MPLGSRVSSGLQEDWTRERDALKPERALVEVLLGAMHEQQDLAVGRATDLMNALLRNRGEVKAYSSEEVGWLLRKLDVRRQRGQNAKMITANRETSRRVHDLALSLGSPLPAVSNCPLCNAQSVESPSVM